MIRKMNILKSTIRPIYGNVTEKRKKTMDVGPQSEKITKDITTFIHIMKDPTATLPNDK